MRTASANLEAHLQQATITTATLWKITRKDEVQLFVTDHDEAIPWGGDIYEPEFGYIRSSVASNQTLSADAVDIRGIIDSTNILEEDLRAGLYDNAEVEFYLINWKATGDGVLQLGSGNIGRVTWDTTGYSAELQDLARNLQTIVGSVFSPICRLDFGGSLCGVEVAPASWTGTTAYTAREVGDWKVGDTVKPSTPNGRYFECTTAGTSDSGEPSWNTTLDGTTADGSVVWTTRMANERTGTVTTVINPKKTFQDSALEGGAFEPDAWYEMGIIEFTGTKGVDQNLNTGLKMDVKVWTSATKEFNLLLPMPFALNAGDSYTARIGCRRRHDEDCVTKFDNVQNFGGEPFVPLEDLLTRIPDAT